MPSDSNSSKFIELYAKKKDKPTLRSFLNSIHPYYFRDMTWDEIVFDKFFATHIGIPAAILYRYIEEKILDEESRKKLDVVKIFESKKWLRIEISIASEHIRCLSENDIEEALHILLEHELIVEKKIFSEDFSPKKMEMFYTTND